MPAWLKKSASIKRMVKAAGLMPAAVASAAKLTRHLPSRHRRRRKELDFFGKFVRPGDLCFDIGANVGNRTDVFLELGARVVAVEPESSCFQVLRRRFRGERGLSIVRKGLGSIPGTAELFVCDDATVLSTFSREWQTRSRFAGEHGWSRRELVPIATLDALIGEYGRPRFCKIDVEGFERQVFAGLSSPIEFVCFEFTRELFADATWCMDRLSSFGNAEFNCTLAETMKLISPTWLPAQELSFMLESEEDPLLWGDIVGRCV